MVSNAETSVPICAISFSPACKIPASSPAVIAVVRSLISPGKALAAVTPESSAVVNDGASRSVGNCSPSSANRPRTLPEASRSLRGCKASPSCRASVSRVPAEVDMVHMGC